MKKYANETIAGIFVLIGLIAAGYMSVTLGEVSLFRDDTYTLKARFTSVSGLRVGSPVEMLGMEIGRVAGMTMDQEDQVAVVDLSIRKDIKVYDDAIASIKTSGLIGDRFVSIDAGGAGELLPPGGLIIDTEAPVDLNELIGKYAFGDTEKPGGDLSDK